MKDVDKLIVIAQTYSYMKKKPFSSSQLYSFINECNFKFHSEFSSKHIGIILSRNKKFKKIGKTTNIRYEAI